MFKSALVNLRQKKPITKTQLIVEGSFEVCYLERNNL